MTQYKIVDIPEIGFSGLKQIADDGTESWIPQDERNADYQQYLASKED